MRVYDLEPYQDLNLLDAISALKKDYPSKTLLFKSNHDLVFNAKAIANIHIASNEITLEINSRALSGVFGILPLEITNMLASSNTLEDFIDIFVNLYYWQCYASVINYQVMARYINKHLCILTHTNVSSHKLASLVLSVLPNTIVTIKDKIITRFRIADSIGLGKGQLNSNLLLGGVSLNTHNALEILVTFKDIWQLLQIYYSRKLKQKLAKQIYAILPNNQVIKVNLIISKNNNNAKHNINNCYLGLTSCLGVKPCSLVVSFYLSKYYEY